MEREEGFIHKYQFLKRMYKAVMGGRYKNKIKVLGDLSKINGPAIIATTHYFAIEPLLIEAVLHHHVFWISDATKWIGKGMTRIRFHDVPVLRQVMEMLGYIEIDRMKPEKHKASMLKKSLLVFKHNGIVGIAPKGGTENDLKRIKIGIKGAIFLAQQGELQLGTKVPIYPVGIKKEKEKYVIRVGEPIIVDSKGDSDYRAKAAQELIDATEELAKA